MVWIKKYGDPRKDDIDAVDWIELIPFKETRNYVQRVLENVQVYSFLENNNTPQPYSIIHLRISDSPLPASPVNKGEPLKTIPIREPSGFIL